MVFCFSLPEGLSTCCFKLALSQNIKLLLQTKPNTNKHSLKKNYPPDPGVPGWWCIRNSCENKLPCCCCSAAVDQRLSQVVWSSAALCLTLLLLLAAFSLWCSFLMLLAGSTRLVVKSHACLTVMYFVTCFVGLYDNRVSLIICYWITSVVAWCTFGHLKNFSYNFALPC